MEFRTSKRQSGMGIDMTPMIDCVFQLLIFFLLSSSFMTPALNLKLPRARADQPNPAIPITVSLDADQRIHVNKELVAKENLGPLLTAEFVRLDKREAIVRAHKGLAYEKVFDVIKIIQRAGGAQVHLAYEGER